MMKLLRKALVVFVLLGLFIGSLVYADTPKGTLYRLEPQCAPGKCLDVQWAANGDGTPVWIYPIINTYAQKWWVEYQSDGYYKITPQCGISTYGVTRCLDVSGGHSDNGTKVQIWNDNGTASQRWRLILTDGYFELEPKCAPGKRLEVAGGSSADRTLVQIYTSNGTAAQRWRIVAVDPLTFYTTCVDDGGWTNPSDRVGFENYFDELGYTNCGFNTNVTRWDLDSLLQGSYTVLYHTGDGYDNGVISTYHSYLTPDLTTMINVKNFICSTTGSLANTLWKTKMGPSCQSLLGYTGYKYDSPTDNFVLATLAGALRHGRTYIQAWYIANTSYSSMADVWCGYVREGASIVEYSARTGRNPATAVSPLMESLSPAGNVKAASHLLADGRTFDAQFGRIRNSEILLNGERESKSEFYQTEAPEFLAKTPISEAEAVTIARTWLGNNLPPNAKLDKVIAIEATVDNQASQVVGYIVRYIREMDGLPFRTNGVDDQITILVNGKSVIAMSKVWPEMKITAKANTDSTANILSVSKVIKLAGPQIATMTKSDSPIRIIDVKPCYGIAKNEVIPAYELFTSQGASIIVDATTGKLVN